MKSKTVAQWLVLGMMVWIRKGKRVNVICIREVKDWLQKSCLGDIVFALELIGVIDEFKITPSALRITHRKTGSAFHFFGLGDIEAVKGVSVGAITGVWFEEFSEMRGWYDGYVAKDGTIVGIRAIINTLNRYYVDPKHPVRFYFTYNPKATSNHWLNVLKREMEGEWGYKFHHSTYKDDKLKLLAPFQLAEINQLKKAAPEYYRAEYLGEQVEGLESRIPDLVIDDSQPTSNITIVMGVDAAYKGRDAIAFAIGGLENKTIRGLYIGKIKKPKKWQVGKSGKSVAQEFLRIAAESNVRQINIDNKEGTYLVEILRSFALENSEVNVLADHPLFNEWTPEEQVYGHYRNFDVLGVDFHGAPNEQLKERKERPSVYAYNKRTEMHMRVQDLCFYERLTVKKDFKEEVSEQLKLVEFFERDGTAKFQMLKKEWYRKQLGKSPDEMDSFVLMIDAVYTHQLKNQAIDIQEIEDLMEAI